MQFVVVTDLVAFAEWLMRSGHWPLRNITYGQYNQLTQKFAQAIDFADEDMLTTIRKNMAFQALTGDSRTPPVDTDIALIDEAGYNELNRRVPSLTDFIARYAAAPNHALLLLGLERDNERLIREHIEEYKPLLDSLLGKNLDLYVTKGENAYQTLRKFRFVLDAREVGFEDIPALLVWSSKAHVAIPLPTPDEAIVRIRKLVTVLDNLSGPLTPKAALELQSSFANNAPKPVRKSWSKAVVIGLGSLTFALLVALAGNLAGTRDFVCSIKALESGCAAIFNPDAR